mgnify:FL=1
MERQAGIEMLKGIGKKTSALFTKLNIATIDDLLKHYPLGYDQFSPAEALCDAQAGTLCAVKGILSGGIAARRAGRLTISTCRVADNTGSLSLVFYNMPYLKSMVKPGTEYVFRGILLEKAGNLRMEQPAVYSMEAYERLLSALQPRYALTSGLTNHAVSKAVKQALLTCEPFGEYLPENIREKYGLSGLWDAVQGIHFPENTEMLAQARRRLVFDEFFIFIRTLRSCKERDEKKKSPYRMIETADTVRFLEKLPYELTGAQKKVWEEIRQDLTSDTVMNRLVQGDVGSGKTILAFLALMLTVANGYQGAMMAPTEVLARQHFEEITRLTGKYGLPFKPVLLTGSMTAKEKRLCYEKIAAGEANVILGTHALIQEKVIYQKLALVVTDEQHRFGVRQREALSGKGLDTHVLVMSATPIPRTLAIILYGDLHISVVDELPAERVPIKNCVVGCSAREKAYRFLEKEIEKGRQAYVICPMIEAGEMDGLENVMDYAEKLRRSLPQQIQISILHGKMKPAEKNRIMEAFGRGDIDILVSTTVIEVGINVPNATVMLIENAERFGLAQLHQLRGRVGRGKEQSYCIFVSASSQKETLERLSILNKSNDGFYIAGEDLSLRGPGDLFGIRQSGDLQFVLADVYRDAKIMEMASEAVDAFPEIEVPVSKEPQVDFRSI